MEPLPQGPPMNLFDLPRAGEGDSAVEFSLACGDCVCEQCKKLYVDHPMDWDILDFQDLPFLNILCDGRRVKL